MGSGFSKMKKQRRLMQEQHAKMCEELENKTVTGSSEGNLVSITLNGMRKMQAIKISPECVDPNDVEGLEDLVRSAYENADERLNEMFPDSSS